MIYFSGKITKPLFKRHQETLCSDEFTNQIKVVNRFYEFVNKRTIES